MLINVTKTFWLKIVPVPTITNESQKNVDSDSTGLQRSNKNKLHPGQQVRFCPYIVPL